MNRFLPIGFLILCSCSNPLGSGKSSAQGTLGPPTPNPETPASTGFEMVSGSQMAQPTASGRKIDITVGAPASEIRVQTSRNRILYLNVQGQLSSNN